MSGCSKPPDWGDDHLILDELELLGENDLWVELFTFPTRPATCNVATCQNVVGDKAYEVIGDAGEARAAALDELLQTWVPTSDAQPMATSIDFQLRDDVEINTIGGTAFLTVTFQEDFLSYGSDVPVPEAIIFKFTSDLDPDWFPDTVLKLDNFSPLGIGLIVGSLCLLVIVFLTQVRRRHRERRPPRTASR